MTGRSNDGPLAPMALLGIGQALRPVVRAAHFALTAFQRLAPVLRAAILTVSTLGACAIANPVVPPPAAIVGSGATEMETRCQPGCWWLLSNKVEKDVVCQTGGQPAPSIRTKQRQRVVLQMVLTIGTRWALRRRYPGRVEAVAGAAAIKVDLPDARCVGGRAVAVVEPRRGTVEAETALARGRCRSASPIAVPGGPGGGPGFGPPLHSSTTSCSSHPALVRSARWLAAHVSHAAVLPGRQPSATTTAGGWAPGGGGRDGGMAWSW